MEVGSGAGQLRSAEPKGQEEGQLVSLIQI